ncbi:MAG TPA: WbqC family protein [Xanthobacteraceae bacterium]|nr:WbqC family protein [Xanthobacteraceae bacterium]
MKRVAILQSNYVPWKGYFDIIAAVDEFILLDDVQFTKNDWRNRNLIKTAQGRKWITIPVRVQSLHQNINEVTVADQQWPMRHWRIISHNYRDAPYFSNYKDFLETLFTQTKERYLSQINYRFLCAILEILSVTTKITWSNDYAPIKGRRTERVVNLCRAAGATHYLSGPAAKAYLQLEQFAEAGIEVEFMDYSEYPEYPQLYRPFDHAVSIIDLILMCGPSASYYIWGWREEGRPFLRNGGTRPTRRGR